MSREMFRTMIPPSVGDATPNLQTRHTNVLQTVSQQSSKKAKRPGSSMKM